MGDTTSGSEDMITANGFIGTPSGEEATSETKVVGGGPLKKGPWTSAEDAILVEYVRKHGEGNWNAVQKHSGLSRCGKSCRLRWANHLRPDLKKGAFSPEEERRIIELHCKMGNKWARMAAELPGRTDNEIKNFWNTRIKRRQRAGLPIYPSDLCLQTSNENQQSQSMATFPSGNTSFPELFQTEIFEIPATEIVNLELTHQLHLPKILDVHNMLDIPPASSFLARGLGPSYSKRFRFSPMDPPNRLCGLECLLPDSSGGDVSAAFNQYQNYDYYLNANDPSSLGLLPGEDGLLNLISASEPIHWATKLELPSLQYSDTQAGSWGKMSSPLPPLESVDTLIHSSPAEHTQLARNSGLLDAVLYPAQNNSLHQFSNASVMGGEVLVDSLPHNLLDAEWGSYGYPLSPRGQSAASDFSAYTPISGTSLDEPQPVDTMPRSEVKKEAVDWAFSDYSAKYDDILNGDFLSRPDMFLGANCFGPYTDRDREN